MKITARYYIASAGMDFALYVFFGAVPFYIISLGGDSLQLGIMQTIVSIFYIVITLSAGRLSDKISRIFLIKSGCILTFLSWFLLPFTNSIFQVYEIMILIGIGTGIFWSPLQAAIADESSGTNLGKNLGNFNLFWSFGKACGFLVCGAAIALFKTMDVGKESNDLALKIPFIIAGVTSLINYFVLPRVSSARASVRTANNDKDQSLQGNSKRKFMVVSWIANFIAFGLIGILANQYPRLATEIGFSEFQFNFYLFCVILCQLIGFWILMRSAWWHYQWKPLILIETAMVFSLLCLSIFKQFIAVLLTAPFIGMGFSMAYYSSIYYSLQINHGKGKNAGIHESILRTGNFFFPLMGGLLATYFGLISPYIFGFVFGFILIIVQVSVIGFKILKPELSDRNEV